MSSPSYHPAGESGVTSLLSVQNLHLQNILSCCAKALGEVGYCGRNNQVLKAIANTICSGISHCKRFRPEKNTKKTLETMAGEKDMAADRTTSSSPTFSSRVGAES